MTDSKPKYRAGRLLALQLSRRGMTGCLLCDGAVERLLSVRFAAGKGLAEALREASDMGRLPEPVGDRTEISLDTDRVCLVPAELFDPSDAGSYLDVHGVSLDDADEVLVSSEVAGAIALMACEGEVCAFLRRRYGEVGFTHPLLDVLRVGPGDEVIEAVLSRDTVHLAAYASGLLYAATLPCGPKPICFICWRASDGCFPTGCSASRCRASCPTGWSRLPRAAFPLRRGRQARASRLGRT